MQRPPSMLDMLRHRIDGLSEEEAGEVLDYITVMQSLKNGCDADPLDELMIRLLVEVNQQRPASGAVLHPGIHKAITTN